MHRRLLRIPAPLTAHGSDALLRAIAWDLGLEPDHQPKTFWPGNRTVAAMLRDANPKAKLSTATYEDAYGERRRRWHDEWTDEAADQPDVVSVLSVDIGYGCMGDGAVSLYARPTPRGIEWATTWEGEETSLGYTSAPVTLDEAWKMLDCNLGDVADDLASGEMTYNVSSDFYDVDPRLDTARAWLDSEGRLPEDYEGVITVLPADRGDLWGDTEDGDDPFWRPRPRSFDEPFATLLDHHGSPPTLVRRVGPLLVPALTLALPLATLARESARTRVLAEWTEDSDPRTLVEVRGSTRTAFVTVRDGVAILLALIPEHLRRDASWKRITSDLGRSVGACLLGPTARDITTDGPLVQRALRAGIVAAVADASAQALGSAWLEPLRTRQHELGLTEEGRARIVAAMRKKVPGSDDATDEAVLVFVASVE